ncbi:heme NO-binding protein [Thioclava sp. BHET1]|nr:heme NO-binding protein [Thioclava sp. BHET1]
MHGLINRSIQSFLRDTYGEDVWQRVVRLAGLDFESFEAMLFYDDKLTHATLDAASALLHRPTEALLEDVGTYLVSHPNLESLRRLMRFGGVTFEDFLHSLEELPARARLAVPELHLPPLELEPGEGASFLLRCQSGIPGYGHVLVGVLRAMADDYGALAVLDHAGILSGIETITIEILETGFAEGRSFSLAQHGR